MNGKIKHKPFIFKYIMVTIKTLNNMNKQKKQSTEKYLRVYIGCYWILQNKNEDRQYEADEEWENRRG